MIVGQNSMAGIHKLLVIRLSALGDVCMTLPVLDSLCRAYPQIEVTLLTNKIATRVASTITHCPNLKLLAFNKKDYKGLSGLNRLYHELHSMGFDALADLHDVLRTKWVRTRFRFAGTLVKVIDKGRAEKKALVSHSSQQQLKSGFERYQQVFAELGLPFELDYDGRRATQSLEEPDVSVPAGSIGIAPFAQHQGKIYPAVQMCRLIDLILQSSPDRHIYLFGGREEATILEQWCLKSPERVHNLAGMQGIDMDLRVMSRLEVMVSMDSANMHLASLVGLRCISVWGATHRYAGFLGYGQKSEDCVELPLDCRPCSVYGNKPCRYGDFRCLAGIEPEIILRKILCAE